MNDISPRLNRSALDGAASQGDITPMTLFIGVILFVLPFLAFLP